MPLHDVKCLNCGHVQEIFYLPGDKPDEVDVMLVIAKEQNM